MTAGDPNLYAYASNRPTQINDPRGEFVIPYWLGSIIGGCLVGAGADITIDLVLDSIAGRKTSINVPGAVMSCVTGATGALLGLGGDKLWPKAIQRWMRPYLRIDRPHHGKPWQMDGKIPNWFRELPGQIGKWWTTP